MVTITSIIARCLSILAIVGLLAVQATGPAAAGGLVRSDGAATMAVTPMDGMAMAMTGSDHCPKRRPASPDCGKGCPWAVLCMASCAEIGGAPEVASLVSQLVPAPTPADDAATTTLTVGPPARPPRA